MRKGKRKYLSAYRHNVKITDASIHCMPSLVSALNVETLQGLYIYIYIYICVCVCVYLSGSLDIIEILSFAQPGVKSL